MFVAELCPLSLPPPVHPEGNPEGAANTKCVKVGSRARGSSGVPDDLVLPKVGKLLRGECAAYARHDSLTKAQGGLAR